MLQLSLWNSGCCQQEIIEDNSYCKTLEYVAYQIHIFLSILRSIARLYLLVPLVRHYQMQPENTRWLSQAIKFHQRDAEDSCDTLGVSCGWVDTWAWRRLIVQHLHGVVPWGQALGNAQVSIFSVDLGEPGPGRSTSLTLMCLARSLSRSRRCWARAASPPPSPRLGARSHPNSAFTEDITKFKTPNELGGTWHLLRYSICGARTVVQRSWLQIAGEKTCN